MSPFADSTPTLEVGIENVLLGRRYPPRGHALAVLDTGFGGFVGIPEEIFSGLGLDELSVQERSLAVANGEKVTSRGTYARLSVRQTSGTLEGFVETWAGLDEILVGSEALRHCLVELDYCLRRWSMQKCGRTRGP